MMAAVDLRAADGSSLDPVQRSGWRLYRAAVRRGALLRPLDDTSYLFPPLNTTVDEIGLMVRILGEAAGDMLAG
jgi:adenosylmethionine-8-amino-7-oxononanoate aminotransferase